MSALSNPRVAQAIDSLIAHLLPNDPQEDGQTVQERHDACFALVKSIINT
jgi:gamma-tubulin complex component 3